MLTPKFVEASLALVHYMQQDLHATRYKPHYAFNIRDLRRLFSGLLRCSTERKDGPHYLIRLWTFEAKRVFEDRLVTKEDKRLFHTTLRRISQNAFGTAEYCDRNFAFGAFQMPHILNAAELSRQKREARSPTSPKAPSVPAGGAVSEGLNTSAAERSEPLAPLRIKALSRLDSASRLSPAATPRGLLARTRRKIEASLMNDYCYHQNPLDLQQLFQKALAKYNREHVLLAHEDALAPRDSEGSEAPGRTRHSNTTEWRFVFYEEAMAQLIAVVRVLQQARSSHMLLIGPAGVGKRTTVRLAGLIANCPIQELQMRHGYNRNHFRQEVKRVLARVGIEGQPTGFLISDVVMDDSAIVADIDALVNHAMIPFLHNKDELHGLVTTLRSRAEVTEEMTPAEVLAIFYRNIREHLHVVVCMNVAEDSRFQRLVRLAPALVNCSTILHVPEWSVSALTAVARAMMPKKKRTIATIGRRIIQQRMLSLKFSLSAMAQQALPQQNNIPAEILVQQYTHLRSLSKRASAQHQPTHLCPTHFVRFIATYNALYKRKEAELKELHDRYQVGLAKMANASVSLKAQQERLVLVEDRATEAQEAAEALLARISVEAEGHERAKQFLELEEAQVSKETDGHQVTAQRAEAELAKVLPAMQEAEEGIKAIKDKNLMEIRSYTRPPRPIQKVMFAVCLLHRAKPTWDNVKKLLTNTMKFRQGLKKFDKNHVPARTLRQLERMIAQDELNSERVGGFSIAAQGLCEWVNAIVAYAKVYSVVAMKRFQFAKINKELQSSKQELAAKRERVHGLERKLHKLREEHAEKLALVKELRAQVRETKLAMHRASTLLDNFQEENARWQEALEDVREKLRLLPSTILICAGTIAYLGPFTPPYRQEAVAYWWELLTGRRIKVVAPDELDTLLPSTLSDAMERRKWDIYELPLDHASVECALIALRSPQLVICIDPQMYMNHWLRQYLKPVVINSNMQDINARIKYALRNNLTILYENTGDEVDLALWPLLSNEMVITIDGEEILLRSAPRVFVTTRDAQPNYSAEVTTHFAIVNCTATGSSVEELILADLVETFMPIVARRGARLAVAMSEDGMKLREVREHVLERLISQKNLLRDDTLYANLLESKRISSILNEQVWRLASASSLNVTPRVCVCVCGVRAGQGCWRDGSGPAHQLRALSLRCARGCAPLLCGRRARLCRAGLPGRSLCAVARC